MSQFIVSAFSDEFATDFNEQLDLCEKYGIKNIEIRNVNGKNFCDHTLEEAKEIKKIMDNRKFEVSAIGSPIGKIGIKDSFEPHLEKFKHVLDIADIVETKYIRVFSFFIPEGENPDDYFEEVLYRWQSFVDHAKGRGITLLHENEKEIYGDTAKRCFNLLSKLNCDYVKATFDPANFIQCDEKTYPDAFELLRPYIEYIHIKDALYKDHTVVPAGFGDGKLKEIIMDLHKNNYKGFLTLEPHLSEFVGFAKLEKGESINSGHIMTGEEILKTSYNALINIVETVTK